MISTTICVNSEKCNLYLGIQIHSMLKKNNHWFLPLLSGFFIGTSYIPFPPWASLFCFVPLWIYWSRQTKLFHVLLGGWLTSFVFTIIGFNWVSYTLHEFAVLPWPLAIFGMLLFACIAHLFVPFAGLLWFIGQKKFRWSKQLSLPIMVLLTVVSEANSVTLFDWNFGYTWYGSGIPIFHWAEIIGFSGLSALTLLFNYPFLIAWNKRHQQSGKIILATLLFCFGALNISGMLLEKRLPKPDASFQALLVQPNIGNEQKLAAELGKKFRGEILNRLKNITEKGLTANPDVKVDFAIWPEASFPSVLGERFKFHKYAVDLSTFLRKHQLPLITGAYSVDQASGLITNSLFLLNDNGNIVEPHYNKSILLAFGEYIPGEKLFPVIRDWLPATGQFAPGNGPTTLLSWNGFKIGPQICYESLFPWFTKDLSNLGAQFIINVTNDSWYGTWQEPYQHMYMTLGRAIEFRRPLLRTTNTGISTVVLASGKILERSPFNQPWFGLYEVPYIKNPSSTFYQRWYWLFPGLIWTILFILISLGLLNRFKTENQQ